MWTTRQRQRQGLAAPYFAFAGAFHRVPPCPGVLPGKATHEIPSSHFGKPSVKQRATPAPITGAKNPDFSAKSADEGERERPTNPQS